MRELDKRASRVIARVREGELVVVSKNGRPVAMILRLEDAVTLLPPGFVMGGRAGELSQEFAHRERQRGFRRILHEARTRGPRPCRRPR